MREPSRKLPRLAEVAARPPRHAPVVKAFSGGAVLAAAAALLVGLGRAGVQIDLDQLDAVDRLVRALVGCELLALELERVRALHGRLLDPLLVGLPTDGDQRGEAAQRCRQPRRRAPTKDARYQPT